MYEHTSFPIGIWFKVGKNGKLYELPKDSEEYRKANEDSEAILKKMVESTKEILPNA